MNPAQATILIVDDEAAILRFLRVGLSAAGYAVIEADTGEAALAIVDAHRPDLIVLDLALPGIGGIAMITRLREQGVMTPIIVLSSCDMEGTKVEALDLGADDYLTKPVGIEELRARVRAALRHRLLQEGEAPVFRTGDLTVDLVRRIVAVRGQKVKLSPREYELLRLMVKHAGKVLTHKLIQKTVWDREIGVQYVRIYVRALRMKIEAAPDMPQYILTELGVGYRLRAPE